MNDRPFHQPFFFNDDNSNNSTNIPDAMNSIGKNFNDPDFLEIYNFYSTILLQDAAKYCNNETMLRLPIIPSNIVIKLCKIIKALFANENIILNLNSPMIIVGDLHGHIMDLFRIIKRFGPPPRTRYLFLGDIVDRGEFSIETIIFIYIMKALYPNEIFVIRGNHEFEEVCKLSGFLDDILSTYKSKELFYFFVESFDYMPIAALINDSILCIHAGIGPKIRSVADLAEDTNDSNQMQNGNKEKQNNILKIKRPIHDFSNDIITSLVWSDPSEKSQESKNLDLPSLISPTNGARILTVKPILENRKRQRTVSNDFTPNHLKLLFPNKQETEVESKNEKGSSPLLNFCKKNDGNKNNNADYSLQTNSNIGENINNPTFISKNNSNNSPSDVNTLNSNENCNFSKNTNFFNSNNFNKNTLFNFNSNGVNSIIANSSNNANFKNKNNNLNLANTNYGFNNANNNTNYNNTKNSDCDNEKFDENYINGFSPSQRGYGYIFDKRSFDFFMSNSNLSLLLRGHQCVLGGISSTFDNRLMTVFSASHYCGGSNNSSAVFMITKFGTRSEIFKSLPYLRRNCVDFFNSESEDSFVIPNAIKAALSDISNHNHHKFNKGIHKASSHLKIPQVSPSAPAPILPLPQPSSTATATPNVAATSRKTKKIMSPSSMIATTSNNPFATFDDEDDDENEDVANDFDPFEFMDDNELMMQKKPRKMSAPLSITGGQKMVADEQDITSRRILRLPCINPAQVKKPVPNGDICCVNYNK